MNSKNLIDEINLALPNAILEFSDKSNIVESITDVLGTPKIEDKGNDLKEFIFEAEDLHELRLLCKASESIIAFSVVKGKQSAEVECPKKWLDNIPQVIGVSLAFPYRGFPIISPFGWFAYNNSRNDASARLALNVAAILPTLCPDTCPPNCQCIPKTWTAEVITSSHTATIGWLGIRIGGSWTSTAKRYVRAYCK